MEQRDETLIASIRSRSLLRYLSDEQVALICAASRFEIIEKEETLISRSPLPQSLYIVVAGEVRFDSDVGPEVATIGQSLELGTLFAEQKVWRSAWQTSTPDVTLLVVPWSTMLAVLKGSLHTYLNRVSRHAELQRLKNDLTICDLPTQTIVEVIANLEEQRDGWIPAGLFVLISGDMRLPHNKKFILRPGDYVFFEEPVRLALQHTATVHFWHLDHLKLTRLLSSAKLALLTTLSRSYSDAKRRAGNTNEPAFENRYTNDERLPDAESRFLWLMQMAGQRLRFRRTSQSSFDVSNASAHPFLLLQAVLSMLGQRPIPSVLFQACLDARLVFPSLSAFAEVARQLGAEAVVADIPLTRVQVPVIVCFDNHYMLVYPISKGRLELNSPTLGRRQLSYQQASAIAPVPMLLVLPFPLQQSRMMRARFLARRQQHVGHEHLMSYHYGSVAMVGILTFFLFLFTLAAPFLTQYLFDSVIPSKSLSLLAIVLTVIFISSLFEHFIHYVRSYLFSHLITVFDALFSSLVVRAAYRLPIRYFQAFGAGDILTRLSRFWEVMHSLFEPLLTLLITTTSAFIYLFIIGFLNVKVLSFVVLSIAVLALVTYVVTSLVRSEVRREYGYQTQAANLMFEHLHAGPELRSAGAVVRARWKWENRKLAARRTAMSYEGYSAILIAFSTTFQEAFRISLLLLSLYLFSRDQVTLGQVIAMTSLAHSAITPIRTLVGEGRFFIEARESFRMVMKILTFRQEDSWLAGARGIAAGEVVLHDVWFQYGNEATPTVLRGVSTSIAAGRCVAVVGRSGAGKSTLSQLLNGLHLPSRGQIYFDRRPATDYPLSVLRENVLLVNQGVLFRGSVAENIAMFRPFSFEEIVKAARAAEIHDVILGLKAAYATRLSEGKELLTSEQRQKLSLARAFLINPKVLILDECFSFFDDATTRRILDRLVAKRRGKTTFIMSHNMLVARQADEILVMEDGRLVEQGNHRELIELRGTYFQLSRSAAPA